MCLWSWRSTKPFITPHFSPKVLYSLPSFPRLLLGTKQGPGDCPGETPSWTGERQLPQRDHGTRWPRDSQEALCDECTTSYLFLGPTLGASSLSRREQSWVGIHSCSPVILQGVPEVFRTIPPPMQSFITDQDLERERYLPHALLLSHSKLLLAAKASVLTPVWGLLVLAPFGDPFLDLAVKEDAIYLPEGNKGLQKGFMSLLRPCSHFTLLQKRVVCMYVCTYIYIYLAQGHQHCF